jgi:DNA-binding HxlR family transcriptional regulator
MRRKSYDGMRCPIARGLERVGEWWSMLIMRDALRGTTRFEQFQAGLQIAPNTLSRRLSALVEAGLLERRRYSEHPPRNEYLPTERGREFRPVLLALFEWGERHFRQPGEAPHPAAGRYAAGTGRNARSPRKAMPRTRTRTKAVR